MSVTTPGIAGGAGRPVLTPALVPGLDIAAVVTGEEASFASVLRDVPVSGVAPAAGKMTVATPEADSAQDQASGEATPDMLDDGNAGNTPKLKVATAETGEAIFVATKATGESRLSEPKIRTTSSEKVKKAEGRCEKEAPHPPADNEAVRGPVALAATVPAARPDAVAQTPVETSRKSKEAGAQDPLREVIASTASGRTVPGAESHLPPSGEPGVKAEPTSLQPTGKGQPVEDDRQTVAPITVTKESEAGEIQAPTEKPIRADAPMKSEYAPGEPSKPSVVARPEPGDRAPRIEPDRTPVTPEHKQAPPAMDDQAPPLEKPVVSPRGEKSAEATALLDLIQNRRTGNTEEQPLAGGFGRTNPSGGEAIGRIADGIVRVPPSPARDKGALSGADAAEKPVSARHGAVATQIFAQLRPAGQTDTVMNDKAMTAETGSPVDPRHAKKSSPAAAEGYMPVVAEKAHKMFQDVRASLAGLFGRSGNGMPQAHDHAVEPGRGDIMATRITPDSPPVMGAVSVSPPPVAMPSGEFTVSGALGRQVVDMGVSGQWIEDIARQVASIATNPGHGSFRIASDNLGAVRVDIRPGAQGSDVMIATDSEAAQTALSQDRDRLLQDARLASIRIGEVRIEKIAAPGEAARGDMQGNGQQGAGTSHSGGQSQSGGQSASMHGGGQHGQHGQQGGRPDASTFAGDGQRGNNPKTSFTQSVLNDAANGRGEAERGGGRVDRARYA